jgi:hypothetical protein
MTFAQDHLEAGTNMPIVRKTGATRPSEQRVIPDDWAKQLSAPPGYAYKSNVPESAHVSLASTRLSSSSF